MSDHGVRQKERSKPSAVLSGWSTGSGFDLIGPSSQSSKHLCIFGLHGAMYCKCFFIIILTYFTLPCRGLSLVGLALDLVDWPTVVLQCLTLLDASSAPVKIQAIGPATEKAWRGNDTTEVGLIPTKSRESLTTRLFTRCGLDNEKFRRLPLIGF